LPKIFPETPQPEPKWEEIFGPDAIREYLKQREKAKGKKLCKDDREELLKDYQFTKKTVLKTNQLSAKEIMAIDDALKDYFNPPWWEDWRQKIFGGVSK